MSKLKERETVNNSIYLSATYKYTNDPNKNPTLPHKYVIETEMTVPSGYPNPSNIAGSINPDGKGSHQEISYDYSLNQYPESVSGGVTYNFEKTTIELAQALNKVVVNVVFGSDKKVKCIATNQSGTR